MAGVDGPLDGPGGPGGAQGSNRTPAITSDPLATARARLQAYHQKIGSWAKVGRHFGLPKSTAYAIAKRGYTPKDRATLRKLDASLEMTVETVTQVVTRDRRGRWASPRNK